MKQNNDKNFVLNISLPILAEITVMNLMSIMDMVIAGNLDGNICVAAISISTSILNTIDGIFITTGLCIAITSLISRKAGAGKYEEANEYASIGMFIGFIISIIIFLAVFLFCKEILTVGGAKGDILNSSIIYTKIFCFSAFIMMINSLFSSIFRAQGNTFVPFLLYAVIFFIKLFIIWFLIYKLNIYPVIISIAISSVISQLFGLIFIFVMFFYNSIIKIKYKYIIKLNKFKTNELLRLTVPSSLEDAAHNISRLLCSFIIIRSGSVFYAADQIANSIESISTMPAVGFGLAATTLAGINIGKGSKKRASLNIKQCAYFSVMLMACFSIIFVLFPDTLVKMYVKNSEKKLIKYAALCLAVGALEQPTIAISSVYNGALKGIGDTKTPFFISLITSWLVRLPLIYYFISLKHFSVVYVWWITAIQWALDASLAVILFKVRVKKTC